MSFLAPKPDYVPPPTQDQLPESSAPPAPFGQQQAPQKKGPKGPTTVLGAPAQPTVGKNTLLGGG